MLYLNFVRLHSANPYLYPTYVSHQNGLRRTKMTLVLGKPNLKGNFTDFPVDQY